MNKYLQNVFIVLLAVFLNISIFSPNAYSQDWEAGKEKVLKAVKQNANSMGRYYVIALPPNENPGHPAQIAAVFVAASERTKVKFTNPVGGSVTKICEPYKTVVFSSLDSKDLFSWDSEVWQSESVELKGWSLESEKPVSVYVINSKSVSTDGYLAIPVAQWGKDYYHCSFWDFKEQSYADWGGGFLIMASEDNTKVNIKLNGRGKGVARTKQGRDIGATWKIVLNKGEVYSVTGDGKTRGGYDLSGSRVTSDKPIGMISYHHRCMIPSSTVESGRDHLNEAMPPIKSWGKKYATVELDRASDKGDYFRAMAAEDNTTITLKWYDRSTKKLITQTEVTLKKAGDFYEFYNTAATNPHNFPSVRGTSVWEGDKPFLLMQYAYSANWDNNGKFDPMYFLVTAQEQYTKSTIFQTPRNGSGTNEYTSNFFNLIATGDTLDPKRNQEILESIRLDGTRVSDLTSGFVLNRIPGTDQFWTRLEVTPGPHYIYGDAPFGGYIYGFASFDSYGWPAATAYRTLGEVDTLAPEPFPTGECGIYEIKVTELRNGQEGDNPRQVETGVGVEPQFTEDSYNFNKLTLKGNLPWVAYPTNLDFILEAKVTDKYADALGIINLIDDANNDTTVVLRYEADSIKINPEVIDFKEVRVNTTSNELIVKVESHSDSIITIKDIKLKKGLLFKIVKSLPKDTENKIKLMPREVKEITLAYTPTQEYQDVIPLLMDLDSLLIETNCLQFAWPVVGKGVIPKIKVSDFNAGIVGVNQKRCITTIAEGLMVENIGSMDLIVTGVDLSAAAQLPFVMSDQATINVKFPFTLKPTEKIFLKELCFEPKVSDLGQGKIVKNVTFISNAGGNLPNEKPVSVWEGTPVQPLVNISGLNYPRVRRLSINKTNGVDNESNLATGIVRVYNTGTQPVTVSAIKLGNLNVGNYSIDYANMKPRDLSVSGATIEIHPQSAGNNLVKVIEVPITFNPQIVGNINEEIIAEFEDNGNKSQAGNLLVGSAFEPMIELTNFTFPKNTIVDRDHLEADGVTKTKGIVKIQNITNNGVEADLEITNITPANDVADFTLVNTINYPIIVKPNTSYDLEYTFRPKATGNRNIKINVLSDAGPSKESTGGARDPKDYPYTGANGLVDGIGINVGGGVVGFNLNNVLTCDNPIGEVVFTNTSTTDILRINSITPDPTSDLSSFTLIDALPTQIPINGEVRVKYQYNADKLGKVIARFNVDFEDPEVLDGPYTLEAFGYKHNVKFDLEDYITGVTPGGTINPYPIKIAIDNSLANNDWADAGIKKFTVDFRYKKTWLTVNKDGNGIYAIQKGDALQGIWNFTGVELTDPNNAEYNLFRITGVNADATAGVVNGNGSLVNLGIRVFFADTANYDPQIDVTNITFEGINGDIRNKCITAEGTDGKIAYQTCIQSVRGVIIGSKFTFEGPDSKIVSGGTIDVKFNVAFDVDTKLEVMDITGALVDLPLNSNLKAGTYQANIPTDKLSNGQYFLRITAGPYSETINVMLQK